MPDGLILAYLAGVIDSDGFISSHQHRRRGVVYRCPLIGIAGTRNPPHLLAKDVWGGSLFTYQPKNEAHRIQHLWQAVGHRAAAAIADILPFLRVKQIQASVALDMWKLISSGAHRTDERLESFSLAIRGMNIRKPSTVSQGATVQ